VHSSRRWELVVVVGKGTSRLVGMGARARQAWIQQQQRRLGGMKGEWSRDLVVALVVKEIHCYMAAKVALPLISSNRTTSSSNSSRWCTRWELGERLVWMVRAAALLSRRLGFCLMGL
jgi:hypothetical protein